MRLSRIFNFALPAVLSAAAAGALAAPASATLVFTGSISGTYDQLWQVADPADDCVSGGGEQFVQFSAAPGVKLAGGISDDGANPHSNGRPWEFGPFKVSGTITRTDNTTALSAGDCFEQEPLPPHNCGGPRSFTVGGNYIYKDKGTRRATFHMALENVDTTIARLFSDARQCFAPDSDQVGSSSGFRGPWPGDRVMSRLHRTSTFAGSEPYGRLRSEPTYLPGGPSVHLNATTTFTWKAVLKSKCYKASPTSRSLRCQ